MKDRRDKTPNLDHFFTPERLAQIDKALAEIDAGKFFTSEQVREYFKRKRAAFVRVGSRRIRGQHE